MQTVTLNEYAMMVKAIIPSALLQTLQDNYRRSTRNDGNEEPVVHLYLPGTGCQWLLTEVDLDLDIAFGLCDLGMGFPEMGYVSLHEILESTGMLCRTLDFKARAGLMEYAHQAHLAREIVLDWPDDPNDRSTLNGNAQQNVQADAVTVPPATANTSGAMTLSDFLDAFRQPLLEQIEQQTPVVYNGSHASWQDKVLAGLKRQPFPAQAERIHAVYAGLVEKDLPAVILNGEMGTGKTMMGICVSALIFKGYSQKPVLVISPPHLVYKWRREILDTVPDAIVHVVNGSNAIHQLIAFREGLQNGSFKDGRPRYLVIGRVRMRLGFYWRPAFWKREYRFVSIDPHSGRRQLGRYAAVACPHCGGWQNDSKEMPIAAELWSTDRREHCQHCQSPLWTMRHKDNEDEQAESRLRKFLLQLPGIGKVTCDRLIGTFGVDNLSRLVDGNVYDFVNLQRADGEFVFNDKQATRLEKALGRLEFALKMVSYQPSEYVKRYFPRKAFSLVLVDEAHEYKNAGSAQGQAMAVLCNEAEKVLPLTGTLMGGYASDLFYLLFRAMPGIMASLGYAANRHNSFAASEERFMRNYGCLIDVFSINDEGSHLTAKGKKMSVRSKKAPGFSPEGIARFVLPYTVFMRLSDLGEGILPDFKEETRSIAMDGHQLQEYLRLSNTLRRHLDAALAKRDNSLTSVVINALLRWPETCAKAEDIRHPRDREQVLVSMKSLYDADSPTPKEADLIQVCREEREAGRRVMVFTTYTGGHDTATRLANLLKHAGLKASVLRSNVGSDAREDWIAERVEQGIDVLICNPELVKTGLDLLAFPTLYFMQTGYNVYTVAQASRRSWRIGQKETVKVYYACYAQSSQVECFDLMNRKIKAALSTMGVMPETGLDSFSEDEDSEASITEALAKQLLGRPSLFAA